MHQSQCGSPRVVVIGSLNMDLIVEAERLPQSGETVLGRRAHFLPGGKGANQAVGAAKLAAETSLIGTVGGDAFGAELKRAMASAGVSAEAIRTAEGMTTGTAFIILSDGDNRIIVAPGANLACSPADIDRNRSVIASADIVLLQLEIPLETVSYAVRTAKEFGKKVILNPAPAQELPAELLRSIDFLTPNRSELALLSGMPEAGKESADTGAVAAAVRKLQDQGAGQVIVTLGAEGAGFLAPEGEFVTVPGKKVDAVDTTGAGDCFNAAFACAIARGESVLRAVQFAVAASALSVTRLGAQAGMPALEEVEHFAMNH